MTDGYGRDKDRKIARTDVSDVLKDAEDALNFERGPADLTDLMEGAVEETTRQHEERLVRSLFQQIRETTVEVYEPTFAEDPADFPDLGREDYEERGAVRIDAEGEPLTVDLLYEAREAAERAGLYPDNEGWEWWCHPHQLNNVREDETWEHAVGGVGTWDVDEEYAHAFCGTPMRTWPAFPKGACLLLDVDVLVPAHGVGSRVPQAVQLKDPTRIVRITSLGVE